jgi:hypothetical protein
MTQTPSAAAPTAAIPTPARVLGFGGLIPFVALGAAVWLLDAPRAVAIAQAQAVYGALILGFLGGSHWGLAFADGTALWPRLSWSVAAPLFAWVAILLLPPGASHGALIVGIAGLHLSERRALKHGWMPPAYFRLRRYLTIFASLALALGALGLGRF